MFVDVAILYIDVHVCILEKVYTHIQIYIYIYIYIYIPCYNVVSVFIMYIGESKAGGGYKGTSRTHQEV